MPKPEFGKKVICGNCGVKFYDLNRKPATCPHCGTEYTEPSIETVTTAKQVFIDEVDIVSDSNLVGSDATESTADEADMDLDDEMDDDTISLEETEPDDQGISNDVDIDIDSGPISEDIDQN